MKTKQAGLGLLLFGVLLIGLGVFLSYNPSVTDWAGIRSFTVYFGGALSAVDSALFGAYQIFKSFAPLGGIISLVLGVGFILL